MQVKVTGRHMTVTDPTREYAEEKFGRIAKIYDAEPIVAEVVLDVRKNRSRPDRFTAEVTVRLKGHVVRAEETSTDMHAAIDLAADKAETQMRKYKTKVIDRRNHGVVGHQDGAGRHASSRSRGAGARGRSRQDGRREADDRGRGDASARASRPRLLRVPARRDRGGQRAVPPKRRRLRADSAARIARGRRLTQPSTSEERPSGALSSCRVDIARRAVPRVGGVPHSRGRTWLSRSRSSSRRSRELPSGPERLPGQGRGHRSRPLRGRGDQGRAHRRGA